MVYTFHSKAYTLEKLMYIYQQEDEQRIAEDLFNRIPYS